MIPAGASAAKDDGGVEGESFTVGNVYEVTLITGVEFKGIVLAYDPDGPEPNIVIFEEGTEPKSGNVKTIRTVNANFITKLKYLNIVNDPLTGKKRSIDLKELQQKESNAISEIMGMGIGVTKEGKKIFDALAKMKGVSVKWDYTDIVVNNEVRIHSPYHLDCVKGGTTTANNGVMNLLEQLDY